MTTIPYAVLNAEGRCVNRVLWNGEPSWRPPDGHTAIPDPDGLYQIYRRPEAKPDYIGFYSALLVSKLYSSMLSGPATAEQARSLAIFVSTIQDCMAGRENPAATQAAIWILLAQIELTAESLQELSGLMREYGLEGIYSLSQQQERARNAIGQFVGDDPSTPDVNEAWVELPQPE